MEKEIVEPLCEYKFNSKDHIHTYIDKPLLGTSTVVGVLAKPLTWWASGLACEKLGWMNSKKKIDGKYVYTPNEIRLAKVASFRAQADLLTDDMYLKLLDEAYKAHSVKLTDTAQTGTDMHAELEQYVKYCLDNNGGVPVSAFLGSPNVKEFRDWAVENVEKFIWSEVHCYSNKLWVGGISDCGVLLKNGQSGIIDFKSSKESYISQFIQCAGYDIQISENGGFTKDGYPVLTLEKPLDFYAIIPFGASEFKIDFQYNVSELQEGFRSCVTLYKLTNK